jgi:hypothetical protein
MCGAADCVACRGPAAAWYGACDACEFIEECGAVPGEAGCLLWERAEARREDAEERRYEARSWRRRYGDEGDR